MGAWGVALFSDDLASDLREDFRDLIAQGHSSSSALDELLNQYGGSPGDPDEAPVFWLAIAYTAWKLGRPEPRATKEALRIIDSGEDLVRFDDAKLRSKRAAVLDKIRTEIQSPPPPARRVPKRYIADNQWRLGQIIGYRLQSGYWILLRVIGHHTDKGGTNAVCELLDWIGPDLAVPEQMDKVGLRKSVEPWNVSQFLFGLPKKKVDQERVVPTEVISEPSQQPGGFYVFVFPYVDRSLEELYGLR